MLYFAFLLNTLRLPFVHLFLFIFYHTLLLLSSFIYFLFSFFFKNSFLDISKPSFSLCSLFFLPRPRFTFCFFFCSHLFKPPYALFVLSVFKNCMMDSDFILHIRICSENCFRDLDVCHFSPSYSSHSFHINLFSYLLHCIFYPLLPIATTYQTKLQLWTPPIAPIQFVTLPPNDFH